MGWMNYLVERTVYFYNINVYLPSYIAMHNCNAYACVGINIDFVEAPWECIPVTIYGGSRFGIQTPRVQVALMWYCFISIRF